MTTAWTREGQVAVFIAVDHHSAECVGVRAPSACNSTRRCRAEPLAGSAHHGTRFEALEPIRQGMRQHFGGFAKGIARGLSVRYDYGNQYMARAFQDKIAFLGRRKLACLCTGPEGNGCAERFIRTLKENLLRVQTFDTVEGLRRALIAFKDTYNTTWLIGRLGHRTPATVRRDLLSPAALAG